MFYCCRGTPNRPSYWAYPSGIMIFGNVKSFVQPPIEKAAPWNVLAEGANSGDYKSVEGHAEPFYKGMAPYSGSWTFPASWDDWHQFSLGVVKQKVVDMQWNTQGVHQLFLWAGIARSSKASVAKQMLGKKLL